MKKVYRVNIQNPTTQQFCVGFGYELTPELYRIKTTKGIFVLNKSEITFFENKLITVNF